MILSTALGILGTELQKIIISYHLSNRDRHKNRRQYGCKNRYRKTIITSGNHYLLYQQRLRVHRGQVPIMDMWLIHGWLPSRMQYLHPFIPGIERVLARYFICYFSVVLGVWFPF